MADFNKFQIFVQDLAHGVHDFSSDALEVALCNAANAPVNTNTLLANLTPIAYTNLSTRVVTTNTSSQGAGTYTLSLVDLVLSASGGAVAGFQYVVVFNQGTTAKVDPLMCWFDYGSDLVLNDGESLTVDFASDGGPNGNLLTLA